MTFLAPLAGLIAAAVTIPLLTLFYFLKLRRRPVRISSTLLWERAVQDLQANAPFRWIRPSLLLFLQLLALASLLAAFARPALDGGAAAPGRLIILIDSSASMSAPLGPGAERTRLDEAKRLALEAVERLSRSSGPGAPTRSSAMVVEFAASARAVTNFTADRAVLSAAIRAIEPTDQPADFDAALRLVEAQVLRAGEEDDGARPRVVLFSDGSLPRSTSAGSAARAGVGAADFSFVRVGPAPGGAVDNLGIVALSARRDYADPAVVRVFVRIQNTNAAPVEAPVRLLLNGEPAGARTVLVPGAEEAAANSGADAAAVPGELATTFELRIADEGVLLVSLARRDALAADDEAGLVLARPRPPRALIVRPALRSAGETVAEASLQRALEEITGLDVAAVDAAAYERLAADRAALGEHDLIVFDRVRPSALPPLPSISFGAALPIPGLALVEPGGDGARGRDDSRILSWRRTHPLLRDVGLDPVVLARPPSLALPTGADAPAARAVIEPIAFGASGPLIAAVNDGPIRRVVVSFALAQSTWTLQPGFVIFLANAVEHLTPLGRAASGRSVSTREPASVRALPGAARLRVRGPVSFEVPVAAGAQSAGVVSLGALPRVGLYTVEGAAAEDSAVVANLVDPVESALATGDAVDVAGRRIAGAGLGETAPREVWHWFVVAALVVSTVEWLLFAWRTRV